MSLDLIQQQKNQFEKMRADNQRLFALGISQLVILFFLSLVVWMNGARIDSFMGDGGPWGRPALERLKSIQPETSREAYILEVFRKVIPLPIVAVKNSFICSTLMWLFVTALMILGFARYQKRQLDKIKEILNT